VANLEATRREILELLETLLDLIWQHRTPNPNPRSPLEATATAVVPPEANSLTAELRALVRALLAAYGASLSFSDKALLRCLILLDTLISRGEEKGLGAGKTSWRRSDGILSQAGSAPPVNLRTNILAHAPLLRFSRRTPNPSEFYSPVIWKMETGLVMLIGLSHNPRVHA
jgi:hypothetical protein